MDICNLETKYFKWSRRRQGIIWLNEYVPCLTLQWLVNKNQSNKQENRKLNNYSTHHYFKKICTPYKVKVLFFHQRPPDLSSLLVNLQHPIVGHKNQSWKRENVNMKLTEIIWRYKKRCAYTMLSRLLVLVNMKFYKQYEHCHYNLVYEM